MKAFITPTYTFTPGVSGVGTVDLSSIPNFDVKRLLAIINQTRGALIYSTSSLNLKYTAEAAGVVTLNFDTSGMNAADKLQIVYEEEDSFVAVSNSSTTPLGIGGVFTGQPIEITQHATINVGVYSDVPSAANGVKVEFSTDGVNWDHSHATDYNSATGVGFVFNAEFKYARVVYTNGGVAQTVFRLQTVVKATRLQSSLQTLLQTVKGTMFAELVKSVLTAKNPNGDYVSIDCTTGGNLKFSLEEIDTALFGQKLKADSFGVVLAQEQEAMIDEIETNLGATNEVAPATDTAASGLNGRLQRIAQRITSLIALLPSSIGQKLSADSMSVVLSSDATLPLPTGAATEAKQDAEAILIGAVTEAAPATDTASSGLNGRLQRIAQRLTSLIALFPSSIGQKVMADSISVTLASDSSSINVRQAALTPSYQEVTNLTNVAQTFIAPVGAKWCKVQADSENAVKIRMKIGAVATATSGFQIDPGRSEDFNIAGDISVIAESAVANQKFYVQFGV